MLPTDFLMKIFWGEGSACGGVCMQGVLPGGSLPMGGLPSGCLPWGGSASGGGGSASNRGSASKGGLHSGGVGQTHPNRVPRDTVNARAVRILLECILVSYFFGNSTEMRQVHLCPL